ncbi:iron-containing alcohol dehydrogenase [Oceanobacter kriegii]|uniref:iron-containing alcohol dehydrogenase n=1 Tax=Oceanobacter kriegii TaxID=64972 RepID=UPI000420CB11|nr:iron-containing alcohol dehydrogenase [Oceanobacter kriegii]
MSNRLVLPRIMQAGAGASKELPAILTSLGCKCPLIITDKMMVKLGYTEVLSATLNEAGMAHAVFDDTVPEPTEASITAGVDAVRAGIDGQPFDSIVALGGGSPIDSAKAIGILGKFGGQMRDYKFPRDVHEEGLPLIAIPTTAGTGSEATRFTIITDDTVDEKMLCVGLGFMPVAALIDYELTLSLPPRVTADTGIDAMTHAMEAYVSAKASPFSDQQALAALRLIGPNLRKAYFEPSDRAAREAMMLGSTLAGIAFSNASVALVHGMSRPIGAFFHVPHGMSNAMLLPAITEFSIPAATARYADCARAMGFANQADSDDIACTKLVAELKSINLDTKVPSLAEFGCDKDKYFELRPLMAQQAAASGSPGNNPKVPTEQEMIALYEKVWNQE